MTSAQAPVCPYCGAASVLIDSIDLYGQSYGMIWRCSPCDAHVGVHRDSPNFQPLGSLANRALRRARGEARQLFDPLWKNGNLSRKAAHSMMRQLMQMDEEEAHIARFTPEQCAIFIERLTNHLASPQGQKLTRPRMSRQEENACDFLDSIMALKLKAALK